MVAKKGCQCTMSFRVSGSHPLGGSGRVPVGFPNAVHKQANAKKKSLSNTSPLKRCLTLSSELRVFTVETLTGGFPVHWLAFETESLYELILGYHNVQC